MIPSVLSLCCHHSNNLLSRWPVLDRIEPDKTLDLDSRYHLSLSKTACSLNPPSSPGLFWTAVVLGSCCKRVYTVLDIGCRGQEIVNKPSTLIQGTLDLLILKILRLEKMHGWSISQRLQQVSGDVLSVSDGSLYPTLHKLEQQGYIEAEWKTSELGRRAKFYSLTRLGRKQLRQETEEWKKLSSAVTQILRLGEL